MKFVRYIFAVVSFSAFAMFAAAADDEEVFDLKAFHGSFVYVDFWASWCGPCRASFPFMNNLKQQYADQGLIVVGINVDSERKDAAKFLAKIPAEFPIYYDAEGRLAQQFGVAGMPHSYLFDAKGELVLEHKGFREKDADELERKIFDALAVGN